MSERLKRLRNKLQENALDAFLVSSPENRRYLSGFTGSAGYLVISADAAILATDFRYTQQAQNQSPHFQVVKTGGDWSWLMDILGDLALKKTGFESTHLTVAAYQGITKAVQESSLNPKPSLMATTGITEGLRTVKDPEELALIQRAIDVADQAMDAITPTIQPGETEQEVAWRLEKAMRELGADSLSFDTIVAAGPNGAMPHHRPTNRPINLGEPVVIDMGAKVDGYCSDITRTICLGEQDETFRRIYDIVLGAQLTAIATVRSGMEASQADDLARGVITHAGYGDNFGHSLGHGLGLAVHEYPGVGPSSPHPLEEGMVFTIEPGIYLPEWGGVRIEDDIILEKDGVRTLSKARK